MVNQILLHISNTPSELVEFCQKNNIAVEAYSPIAHGEILDQPEIVKMAEAYGVTVPHSASAMSYSLVRLLYRKQQIRHIWKVMHRLILKLKQRIWKHLRISNILKTMVKAVDSRYMEVSCNTRL